MDGIFTYYFQQNKESIKAPKRDKRDRAGVSTACRY
jgi:hypothetical protein